MVPAPSRRELWGAYLSTWVCAFEKAPTVNPSVKNQRFLPAPFHKGACGQCPLAISHGSFLLLVPSLTRPVSLPCRGLRLYLPPGGRWLGAQPQDGGSQRAANQFDHQRWNLPRIKIQSAPSQESSRYNGHRVSAIMSKYQPICKPELHRPQAPSGTCGASSLPEGAMGCVPFHMGLCF